MHPVQDVKYEIRKLVEGELSEALSLYVRIFGDEDDFKRELERGMKNGFTEYSSLFIGCFESRRLIGAVVGWLDNGIIAVKAIAVDENYRRRGIGRSLLEAFDQAVCDLGRDNYFLGARWDAVPFYSSCGLVCFANAQVKPESIPWDRAEELRNRYQIISCVIFSPVEKDDLMWDLIKTFRVKTGQVRSEFESISIQIKASDVTKETLEAIKDDFNAYSTQFCFKKV
jgi:GNAT superfamily N-acetyltransferase